MEKPFIKEIKFLDSKIFACLFMAVGCKLAIQNYRYKRTL